MAILAPVAGVFGGPLGSLALAALGIGIQVAAAYFFPQKVKGPRLDDLKAQTSRYGDQLARIHGTDRVAGAVPWLKADHIDEHQDTDRKGSLGPVVTEFTYTADFALAFAWNGPAVGIPRLWADDKICYDNSAETLQAQINGDPVVGIGAAEGATFTFYLGADDQAPDPSIEADRGVGLVPAWPRRVYIVIRNFPLEKFGQRLPNFEAEVVMVGNETTITSTPTGWGANLASNGSYFATADNTGTINAVIHKLPDTAPDRTVATPDISNIAALHITAANQLVVIEELVEGNHQLIDLASGAITPLPIPVLYNGWEFAVGASAASYGNTVVVLQGLNIYGYAINGIDIQPLYSYTVAMVDYSSFQVPFSVLTLPVIASMSADTLYIFFDGGLYTMAWAMPADPTVVWTANLESPPSLSGTPKIMHWDEDSDSVIIVTTTGIYVYNPDFTTLIASRTGDWTLTAGVYPQASQKLMSGDSTFIVVDDTGDVWEYQLSDLALVQHIDGTEWSQGATPAPADYVIDPILRAITIRRTVGSDLITLYLPKLARGADTLAAVIARECGYAGVANDVTAITGDVRGYAARQGESARGVLEDLMRVKFFDFAQSGGLLKFFMRTATPSGAIALVEMGYTADDVVPKFCTELYPDIAELPSRIVLNYASLGGDYRKGAQSVSKPDESDETDLTEQFETNLVLTDDEAAQSADIYFDERREAASIYRTAVGPKHFKWHPGDVLGIDLDTNRSMVGVLTKQEGEFPLNLELRRRTALYTSTAVGVPVTPNTDSIFGFARSGLILIDGHLMRTADDDDSFYLTVYPAEAGKYPSATAFKSEDGGSNYGAIVSFQDGALVGTAASALPDRPHPWAWDRVSSLTFHVASVTGVSNLPATVTEAQLLANPTLNAFAIRSGTEWEYIRATSVVDNADGTWTIGGAMLRARSGTEFAMAGHAIGDTVVHLHAATMARAPEGDKDLARLYTAITSGKIFVDTFAQSFTNTSRGLRPWSPVHVESERDVSGNLTVTATRRDRLGESELVDDPPMSEASESYRADFYNGALIVQTVPASTLSFAYSAADQTTDFGSPQAAIDVRIYQLSAAYGDGVPAIETV